ncbi:MAG: T9SS type A sorting domain-containing protein [Bacteroidales bacterium]|nr:T9SS type A sorting domain-containing protein [Bacteroidales bacterium]
MKKIIILLLAVFSMFAYGQQITQIEYFFDTDPGFGQATSLSVTPSEDVEIDQLVDLTGLEPGFHDFNVRVKDESGDWSSVMSKPFFIDNDFGFSTDIVAAEWFIDIDPGFGEGESISISAAHEIAFNDFIEAEDLSTGAHLMNIRVKDENNKWSPVLSAPFYIDQNNGLAPKIDYIEYFVDDDPGYGNGIPYTDFTEAAVLSEVFFANMLGVTEGQHSFSIRMRNQSQLWSQILVQNFELVDCDLNITGEIKDQSGSTVTSGMVVLFQYFGSGSAIGVDTVYLSDGSYHFSSVCPNSDYYIKVLPEDGNGFLATYYGDSPYWQEAEIVTMAEGSQNGKDIIITDFAEIDLGTNSLGGHIYETVSKGEPVKNIDVVLEFDEPLEKGDFEIVANVRTDLYGEWEINDLPLGDFKIKVEIPGLEMDTTYLVEITVPDTHIHNLDYYIDFNTGIFIDHTAIPEYDLSESLSLFPNPNSGNQMWIETDDSQIVIQKVTIFKYSGQHIQSSEASPQSNKIDVSQLSKGFYLVHILTNKGMINKKIIIH